jgi:hypothetical protein
MDATNLGHRNTRAAQPPENDLVEHVTRAREASLYRDSLIDVRAKPKRPVRDFSTYPYEVLKAAEDVIRAQNERKAEQN